MELAVNAQAEVPPMKPLLGVLYDELARLTSACLAPLLLEAHGVFFRKDWADKAAKLGAGFDVEKAAAALNPSSLARAVKLHNTLFAVKAVGSASPSGSVQVGGRRPLAVDVGPLGCSSFLQEVSAARAPKRAAAWEPAGTPASKQPKNVDKIKCFKCKVRLQVRSRQSMHLHAIAGAWSLY